VFKGLFEEKKVLNKLEEVEKGAKKSFSKVKKEFEEHLEAINENTNEIQSNYELMLKLESKIDKMENALAEINRFISQYKSQNVYFLDDEEDNPFTVLPLTLEEKRVFRAIYELEAENVKVTYAAIADLMGISSSLAREYITSLIEKGVPVIKNYLNQKVYLNLEPNFKDIQTKQNIVNL